MTNENASSTSPRFHFSYGGSCHSCQHVFPPLYLTANQYFRDGTLICKHCENSEDIWESMITKIREGFPLSWLIWELGATVSVFYFDLSPGQTLELDFSHFDIPPSALILDVSYTGFGNNTCQALELHGNRARSVRYGNKTVIYGKPIQGSSGSGKVQASITWVLPNSESDIWLNLADAFHAATSATFPSVVSPNSYDSLNSIYAKRVVIPAFTALESTARHFVNVAFEGSASKKALEVFQRNTHSSDILDIILPFVAKQIGFPPIPHKIHIVVTRLRSMRNKMVHSTKKKEYLASPEVGELLCGAVFSIQYIRCVIDIISTR